MVGGADAESAPGITNAAAKADIPVLYFGTSPGEEEIARWEKEGIRAAYVGSTYEESAAKRADLIASADIEKIDESGSLTFNVSLSSVATWLDLPLETKNPKHNVKEPIEKAVKQIAESLDPNNFKIEIKTDLNASLSQYLTGYLEITIGGAYTQNLFDMNEKQQARIDRATRRKEALKKEATIRKIVEQMKEADQAGAKESHLT